MTELDQLIALRGYASRSEAVRDVARAGIQQALIDHAEAPACVAVLMYVQASDGRDLPKRLAAAFRENHDLSVATMQSYLNHTETLDVALLRGRTAAVRHLAEHVLAERGVRHGRLVIVPAHLDHDEHRHDDAAPHTHTHVHPR